MMIFLDMFLTVDGLVSSLEAIDKQYLLAMNGSGSLYLDRVARTLTTAFTWVPFYISLFFNNSCKNSQIVRITSHYVDGRFLHPFFLS